MLFLPSSGKVRAFFGPTSAKRINDYGKIIQGSAGVAATPSAPSEAFQVGQWCSALSMHHHGTSAITDFLQAGHIKTIPNLLHSSDLVRLHFWLFGELKKAFDAFEGTTLCVQDSTWRCHLPVWATYPQTGVHKVLPELDAELGMVRSERQGLHVGVSKISHSCVGK